ncbi:M4 family metallopeptidase [Jatrophihabitans sp. YIM 134969]
MRTPPAFRTAAVATCTIALTTTALAHAATASAAPVTTAKAGGAHVVALAAEPGSALTGPAEGSAATAAASQRAAVAKLAGLAPSELTVAAVRTGRAGTDVRYQQVEAATPVRGAVVVASLRSDGAVLAVQGRSSGLAATAARPATTAAAAASVATSKAKGKQAGTYRVTGTTLQWYDPAVAKTGASAPQLVYSVSVVPNGGEKVYGDVLVSAADNAVVADETQQAEALRRAVCDVNSANISTSSICNYSRATRAEGGGSSGIADVDAAYTRFGTASDFYASLGTDLTNLIGYSSSTSGGKYLSAITRACPAAYGCPMQNAFWNGYGMVFGAGFTQADDVITHELTHGVTQNVNNLQNGAINESMSDIMGEFEDIENGAGNDSASVAWLVGEDLPGIGAIRDMSNPPASVEGGPHPDRIGSPDFDYNGEVHGMSGPTSKTAYLITAGGSFNGYSVSGIGYSKAEALFWKVENTLTAYSGWESFNTALASACSSLQSTGVVTASDCTQVANAKAATELTLATDG